MRNAKIRPFQKAAKYYARKNAKRVQYYDGESVTAEDVPGMVTRYGYRRRGRQPKDVYVLHTGEWVEIASIAFEGDETGGVYAGNNRGHYFVRVADRWVHDRHRAQTRAEGGEVVRLHIVDGRVAEVVGVEGELEGLDLLAGMSADEAGELAHLFLGITFPPAPLAGDGRGDTAMAA